MNKERDLPWGAAPLSLLFPHLLLQISRCPDPFITSVGSGELCNLERHRAGGDAAPEGQSSGRRSALPKAITGPRGPHRVPWAPDGYHHSLRETLNDRGDGMQGRLRALRKSPAPAN